MKHRKLASLVLAGAVGLSACSDMESPTVPATAGPSRTAAPAAAGSQLVVFESNAIPAGFAERVEALGGRVDVELPQIGVAYISGIEEAGLAALSSDATISALEPEVVLSLVEPATEATLEGVEPQSPAEPGKAAYYAFQWNMKAIGADRAWAAGHLGSSAVTVGIIDTGLDYTHPDLKGRVDLARSRSFLPTEDAVVAKYLPAGTHPVFDLQSHGTHVGATVSSNGKIAAGVTSQVTLVGLKVCRSGIPGVTATGCPSSATFAALLYAADSGVDVVNMSLGGLFTRRANPGYVSVINRVFNYVRSKSVTVVVAAGNDNVDLDHALVPTPVLDEDGEETGEVELVHYPSLYGTYCNTANVICVSATGPAGYDQTVKNGIYYGPFFDIDAKASYSNYGRSAISVAAPGGTSNGYIWAACPTFRVTSSKGVVSAGPYDYCTRAPSGKGGTSMAAPHVAGLAALMVEKHGKNPAMVANALRRSSDDLGARGQDATYGAGRINVARALNVN